MKYQTTLTDVLQDPSTKQTKWHRSPKMRDDYAWLADERNVLVTPNPLPPRFTVRVPAARLQEGGNVLWIRDSWTMVQGGDA
jgi:hypothetical protein